MSTVDYNKQSQKLSNKAVSKKMMTCKACNEEFELDAYFDHVYDNEECYRAYIASEKKEMSKL